MIDGFKIGHYSDTENATGCTVILCPDGNTASCYISGSAPGSRELALLAPERKIQSIHGLLLTGGSAFGLNATAGVMQYLEEQNIGYDTSFARIPIIPAAVIYDLNVGSAQIRPVQENAYAACKNAALNNNVQGSIGAGTGATVGKWAGMDHCMKGGLGLASIKLKDVVVAALCVVNPVGDVIDKNGGIVAGAVDNAGRFLATQDAHAHWHVPQGGMQENTVLCAILTNAQLDKGQVFNLAKRGQNGIARAVDPASTSFDGDVIFAIASNAVTCDLEYIYQAGAEAVRQAIINGVKNARTIANIKVISGQDGQE
jgi:L-aminopeptidase/D-esterase-like protein